MDDDDDDDDGKWWPWCILSVQNQHHQNVERHGNNFPYMGSEVSPLKQDRISFIFLYLKN